MILYLDTSALVKRYFREAHTDDILSKWVAAKQIVTSSVAYAETMAAIYRKKREANLEEQLIQTIVALFSQDWVSFVRVEVNDDLNATTSRLVETYPLSGFDAIHLASAMAVQERFPHDFVFGCFDNTLLRAARAEGIETFPQSDTAVSG
ncbi:MAG: type II toxin-antitoxin system VapC family toxin [Deltaproteobacteria bacterium]|nr:type II toxin-antitoxin system VapC family toxin [Deltaproteobacteria bacterium]